MSHPFVHDQAVWALAVGVPVTAIATIRGKIAALRRSASLHHKRVTDRDEELAHLVEASIPALMDGGQDPVTRMVVR